MKSCPMPLEAILNLFEILVTPGPSIVLPLKWGMIQFLGPGGRSPGVDVCVAFYS